ncbi:spore cortex biosynthesis protein YabQ [Paenibacillus sp. P96]|uniref:Spore cortex biosynthesis protein YabQ n=1 Tax=Paenibacillus zeirhizosphaerae TaxID=2987519 RepID=A0ABT9FWU3_9BACL|nr:spore cortex biosynthesis protein YabQ [Paenibacillus sp. P96]MDP4099190.1 spore cortex biosynthesis protein YabQ [Paenibacillus sp. P96]
MSPNSQWFTLMYMLFSGAAMGAVFDSYRVLSYRFRLTRWSIHLIDLLYWVLSAVFIFRMLYASNRGELRFYVFLGLVLGALLYFWTLSVTVQLFVVKLIELVRKLTTIVYHIFRVLVLLPLLGLYRFISAILVGIGTVLLYLGKMVLALLKPFGRLILWMLRPITSRWRTPAWAIRTGAFIKEIMKRWFVRR